VGIVTKEMIEESKKIDLKVIDKNIYESARACHEAHRLRTGRKSKRSVMDDVRLAVYIESLEQKSESNL